ncbi:MAG: sodium:solute symporter [Gemmatimonadetes bacterium]|nr:sodium:solute symporter [Gemmatimonadota bacterium]
MSAAVIDWAVVLAYFAGTIWLGSRLGRGQRDLEDYFLAGRRTPWFAASLSIVGTETSTLTFVGVPAIAYTGNLGFLQVAAGYVLGRLLVAWWLVPAYFEGRIHTAYELLAHRFGERVRRFSSAIFLVSRVLADGVRLFATALVLQALLPMPLPVAILLVTGVTLYYTMRGGLRAVIWNDAVQLVVYVGGAALAAWILLRALPGGWSGVFPELRTAGKLGVFDFGWNWTRPYTFWAGILGGAVLTMATHGTDQMFVQRLLACRSASDARKAVVTSGILVFGQMALFLIIGSLLFAFYAEFPPSTPFESADQVFARFIATEMPAGLGGLVIAAVFAAAMSTLSSSMSSLASASTFDFDRGETRSDESALRASRLLTAGWAAALAGVAVLARAWGSVLEAGLTITSITFGPVLGVFGLAAAGRRVREDHVIVAMVGGLAVATAARLLTPLAWTWLTPLGAVVTFGLGWLLSVNGGRAATR